jgi:Zn-dependent M28 family amino/carboxypeptidase
MRCAQIIIAFAVTAVAAHAEFSGARALEYTRRIVAFGPRPPGSPALAKTRAYILGELKRLGVAATADEFPAQTPRGRIAMKNLIAHFPGSSGRAIAITGHYDTKYMPGIEFVGASDGGSSAGFLLEMAAALKGRTCKDDLYLVWFDGEEAIGEWSETDSLYGSRHLAKKWSADGTLARLKALINVDMIGDRKLEIVQEYNSTAWLRALVWQTAHELGYGRYFTAIAAAIEDDHVPFLRAGAPALDLIHNYGREDSHWHTPRDTMDKLDARSFEAVGAVLLEALTRLEKRR